MPHSTESHLVVILAGVVAKQAAQLSAVRGPQTRLLLALFTLSALSIWQRLGPLPTFVPVIAASFLLVMVIADQVIARVVQHISEEALVEIVRLIRGGNEAGAGDDDH